jgi:isopenicillin-N epimerase
MNRLKDLPNVRFNKSFDDSQYCAIANVNIDGVDPIAIGSQLMSKHKIFATPIVHDEFKSLRITPKVYTTIDELNRFCAVMESVAEKGLPKD